MHIVSRSTMVLMVMFIGHYCQPSPLQDWLDSLLRPPSPSNASCPHDCSCTSINLASLINNYIDFAVPQLGGHMRENLATETKQLLTGNFLAALVVNNIHMTEIKCQRSETFSLEKILEESPTRDVAIEFTCTNNATLVWDSHDPPPPTYSIRISNCFINTTSPIKVSSSAWIVHFDRINPSAAAMIDFSVASSLIDLSVTNSSIMDVPATWGQHAIPKLVFINLEGNLLTNYSCSVGLGTVMDTINLNNNALTRIPHCIVVHTQFQPTHLSLASNDIYNISELFQDNTNFTVDIVFLNFQKNKITELGIFKEAHISSLDLTWNNIKIIPEGVFDYQKYLMWLDLSHNQISYLSRGPFKHQYLLRYINLSYNQVTEVTFDQGPVSIHIVDMDLTYNQLLYPPFYDTGYISPRLTKITIANNPFVCDCNMESFLQFMTELKRTAYLNFVALTDLSYGYEMNNSLVQPYIDIDSAKCYEPQRKRTMPILNINMTVQCPIVDRCPKTCMCYKEKKHLQLVVNCTHTAIKTLPVNFPTRETSFTFVGIFDNGDGPESIEYRSYLSSISELYASNTSIHRITAAAMTAMQDIHVLHLHSNNLSELPRDITTIKLASLRSLTLHSNPWQCNCNTKWFPKWLQDHKEIIDFYNEITCIVLTGESKHIEDISLSDFHCGEDNYLHLVIAFTVLIVFITASAGIVYKYRLEIRVLLYTRFKWCPFDHFKFEEEEKEFDAFVSFSEKDYQWIVHTLIKKLEGPDYHRKLCVHYRDFPVGAPVVENILWAITNSKCTLLLLTNDFLQSEWCMYEFREAHQTLLETKDNKLIIILKGDVDKKDLIDENLRAYLRTHTYFDVDDKWFWSKLDYVIPVSPHEDEVEQRV